MKSKITMLILTVVLVTSFALNGCSGSNIPKDYENKVTPTINAIWAVNDGEKVALDDLNNPNKASNTAWNGKRVKIFGGRNEIIAFQLIVEAGPKGIDSLSVSLPKLSQRGGKSSIVYSPPEEDPTQYVGKPIQIFSINYMYVEKLTQASWIIPDKGPAIPENALGWKPVQLVPENAIQGKGGFPLTVQPETNQGIWFEIYTAKDLNAGFYDGVITVTADDEKREIPIELELFDFTLPDENSMNAMFYFEDYQTEMYHGTNMQEAYHRFAHRNRVEFVTGYDLESANKYIGRFNGSDFTKEKGYEGPGEGVGNKIIPRTFYGPGTLFDERKSAWKYSDEWMNFINKNFPDAITFVYMPDEPGGSQYSYIRDVSENIKSNPGPGKDLPIFVTKSYTQGLDTSKGVIDIWCAPAFLYAHLQATKERSHGDDMWIYNGGRPNAGAIIYETPATDPRANIWGCFKNDIKVYFYWHSDHWYHNSQIRDGIERTQNIWANPVTYHNKAYDFANGDGVLVYPGEEIIHPEENRGIKGPCSSIQMANFRRGMQDHLYLTMAEEKGLDDLVFEVLEAVVPDALSPTAGAEPGFAETGNEYEEARYKLAKALAGKK